MTYRYQVYTSDRKLVDGTIQAATEGMAEEALYLAGYKYVVSLKATRPRITIESVLPSLFGVKPQDVIEFSRQLATFVASGISLFMALELVAEQITKPALKKIVSAVAQELQGGSSFSQAVSHYPAAFSYAYYQIIKASEQAGDLESGLRQIADYMEKQIKISGNIRRAMTYPAIIVVMAIGVSILMITVVLPPIMNLFKSVGATLPWTTKMLIAIVNFITVYKLPLVISIVALAAALYFYFRTSAGKRTMDKMMLQMPLIGKINVQRIMGHLCRTASMMSKSGLQLPEILEVTIHAVSNNQVVNQALTEVREKLMEGKGLSGPMSENKLFPPTMIKMLAMGEQTGNIDTALTTLATYFEEKAAQNIESLIAMIEPVMTIVMGLGVAFIMVAILLPMYSVLRSIH